MDSLVALAAGGIDWTVFILLLGGILIGIQGERWRAAWARAEWRAKRGFGRRPSRQWPPKQDLGPPARAPDSSDQMRQVLNARFDKRRLLSRSEERVFREAEKAVADLGKDWRVMAQVCLGEILSSPKEEAFRAINAKRVDMLIVCGESLPVAAIEYQGGGHYQKDAAARDAVKKEALRIAGVDYIEIKAGDRSADLKWAIARLAHRLESGADAA